MSARRRNQPGPTQVRSWKSIQQKVPRSATPRRRGKSRYFLVWIGAIFFSVGMIFLSYLLLFQPERLFQAGGDEVIEEVAFETNGTLSKDWLLERMDLPEGATLLQTDIFLLREKVQKHPQVEKCIIQRKFPSTLYVKIAERAPVLRLQARSGNQTQTLFVARDGVIFPGIGRGSSDTRRMPFLTGVDVVEVGEQYAPIPGFRAVADLVDTAKSGYPEVYRSWRIVDLSLYDADPAASFSAIRVRATDVGEILFAPESQGEQLLRLKDILTLTKERGVEKLQRIDLRFDESVPVVAGQES